MIVGQYWTFTDELINKLNKEGWCVYTLVSDKYSAKHARVFEQYHFDYASDSINEVIGSCRPDVILFTGAYDPLYQWTEKSYKADAKSYITGLNNLLICAKDHNIRHFVYLSSESVFEESFSSYISEDVPPAPSSKKSILIYQGEELVSSFCQFSSLEVSIVRIADLYFIPKSDMECRDRTTKMCLNALITGSLSINAKRISAPLYISDAVQAIFLLINAPERKYSVYHISAENEVTEYDIAQCIKIASDQPISIVDQTIGEKNRTILSSRRFCEEFGFKVRVSYSEAIPKIVLYMRSQRNKFSIKERNPFKAMLAYLRKMMGDLFPFLECILMFFLFYTLNYFASKISYFRSVDIFLLFVLLFAVIRGRQLAIFALALSVAGYCYQRLQVQTGLQLMINTNTYTWIAQLFIVGITAGHLRDRLTQLELEKDEEIKFLSGRMNEIFSVNASNTKIKDYLQERIVNSTESIGWYYEIISQFDSADSGDVMFIATGFLSKIMGTMDVAIYSMSSNNYCRLVNSLTPRAMSLGKSIYMPKYEALFEPLKNNTIFVNKTMNAELPSLASSLTSPDGEMQIVFLLWDLDYEKMTLHHVNTLKVLGTLICNAVIRSAKYMDALSYKRYVQETRILQWFAFEEICAIYQKARKNKLTDYCVLEINSGEISIIEWSTKLSKLLRMSDIIGVLPDKRLGILLPNTSKDEARIVIDRIKSSNIVTGYMQENSND